MPSRVPSLRALACSPHPGRAEGGGGGEGGERGGGRQAREGELLGARTFQSQPGARTQRLSGSQPRPATPHLLLLLLSGYPSPPPSSSCYLGRRLPPSLYSATSPTLGSLLGRASSPHPFFLPSLTPARPLQVSLLGPDCLRPLLCPPAPSPAPSSPSHFLSRPPPQSRRGTPSRSPSQAATAPAPAPAARGARGREKWASSPSPSPAPQPCPAREDREDEQRRQSREGEHPERGQPSGGRGTVRWWVRAGTAAAGLFQSAGGWRGAGPRAPGCAGEGAPRSRVWESSWLLEAAPGCGPGRVYPHRVCFCGSTRVCVPTIA